MPTDYKTFIGNPTEDKNESFGERLLKRATHYRDCEINLTWERAKYFTLFLSAIFVAYCEIKPNCVPLFVPTLLMGLGTVISWIWYWVNRGSKQTYENWEHHIDFIEESYHLGNISRVHIHKNMALYKLLGGYPISASKANNLVSLVITFAFAGMFIYESGLWKFIQSCISCNIGCSLQCLIMILAFIGFYTLVMIPYWIKSGNYSTSLKQLDAYNRIKGTRAILEHNDKSNSEQYKQRGRK